MSKHETPMVLKYWEGVGGTLIEEFPMVRPSATCGPRYADAVILPNQKARRVGPGEQAGISLEGEDVIVVQAKASWLGIYLMGQALFSAELIRRFRLASVRSVALCTADDAVLRTLLEPYPHVEVVVMGEFGSARPRRPRRPDFGPSMLEERNSQG
jgi:hypothetical protein